MEIFYSFALPDKLDLHLEYSYRKIAPLNYTINSLRYLSFLFPLTAVFNYVLYLIHKVFTVHLP